MTPIDFSELSTQEPLLIGEAPIDESLEPFVHWLDGSVPATTGELLDLAFGIKPWRSELEAHRERQELNEKFALSNILSTIQDYKDPARPQLGRKFDEDTAARILLCEIIKALRYKVNSGEIYPHLYGRLVIIFGRVGEALASASAMMDGLLESDEIRTTLELSKMIKNELESNRYRDKMASHDIYVHEDDKIRCVTKFIWLYHPSHLTRKSKNEEDEMRYNIPAKREMISKILKAGISGDLIDIAGCSEQIDTYKMTPLTLPEPLRNVS